jgi:predicted Zn-dependent peptidase
VFTIRYSHAQSSSKDAFTLPAYDKFQLSNGLTIYLLEQHEVPLIHITAMVPAGATRDRDKSGLASLTAESLLFGTTHYTKNEIEETMDFLGARLSAYATPEAAFLDCSVLKDHQDQVLPIVKELLANPVFPAEEYRKRQARLLAELDQAKESPKEVIGTYFTRFLFGEQGYGNPVQGTKSTVSAIQPDDLKTFYLTHYDPSESAIAIVGDFKSKKMKLKLKALFKDWDVNGSELGAGAATANATKLPYEQSRVLLINKGDATETAFYIGSYGISRNNEDYVAIEVINTILGGRFTSWLNDELRVNSGLSYGARSFFKAYKQNGYFAVSSFTQTATTTEAIDLALQVLNRLHKQGVDEKTLASAKNYIKGQFPPRYETSASLANLLVSMYLYDFNESFINTFQQKVDELTVDKAKDIIRQYFPKENLQFVLIGKAAEIREKVQKYGTVVEKDILAEGF